MTYTELIEKYGTLTKIAMHLGYCTEKSTEKRRLGAKSRVSNWKRTGIPARVLKRLQNNPVGAYPIYLVERLASIGADKRSIKTAKGYEGVQNARFSSLPEEHRLSSPYLCW